MKKIVLVLLAIVFLVPLLSSADTESDLVGTWIGMSEQSQGNMAYFFLRLFDDHTAVYEVNHFSFFDSDGMSFVTRGNWELLDDGIHVYTNNYWEITKKEEHIFYLTQAHYLAMQLSDHLILLDKMLEPRPIDNIHFVSTWDD